MLLKNHQLEQKFLAAQNWGVPSFQKQIWMNNKSIKAQQETKTHSSHWNMIVYILFFFSALSLTPSLSHLPTHTHSLSLPLTHSHSHLS